MRSVMTTSGRARFAHFLPVGGGKHHAERDDYFRSRPVWHLLTIGVPAPHPTFGHLLPRGRGRLRPGLACYLQAFRKATRSASSWWVSCWSRPAGMIETVLGRISSISRRAMRASWLTPVASTQLVGCLAAKQAVVDLAVAGGDGDRLEAAHQAGAREDDRLEQVALGPNRADLGQVGADVAAAIADGVAGVAGGLFTVEDELAPADVAGRQRGQELLELGFLLGRIDVDPGEERLGTSFWTAAAYFARWALTASARRLGEADESPRGAQELRARAIRRSIARRPPAAGRLRPVRPSGAPRPGGRSCSGVSLARASTSAAVVRLATVSVATSLREQKREETSASGLDRPPGTAASAPSEARRHSWRQRRSGASRAGRSPAFAWQRAERDRPPRQAEPARHLACRSSSTLASAAIQLAGTCFSFRPDQAMACRLLWRAAQRSRCVVQAAARSSWIGAACASRPSCLSSSARSAADRSARSSRWPRTPASAPAHSRCRPTIHDAVSLSTGSVEASSPATNARVEPAAFHLVECDEGRSERARDLAL